MIRQEMRRKGTVNTMSLLLGAMHQHIPGFKELSEHKDVIEVKPGKEVFIPLFANHSQNFELLVKEGDSVLVGTKLAICKERMTVPIYSSVSGVVKGMRKMMHASLKPIEHIVIEPDGKQETIAAFEPLNYEQATKEELVEFMMNAGIVGCGGACFPTYMKYRNVKGIEKLIINAVECEPFITADYKMVEAYCDEMVYGIKAMKKMADAKEAVIAIKKSHPELISIVEKACADTADVHVAAVPDVYPMGWERVLVRELMHKEYEKLPAEVGAIVNNATTAIAFARALTKGMPIVDKVVTVSGDGVKNPVNVHVAVGTPVHEIIAACGGYTAEDVKLIAGGPMMGKTIVNDQWVIDRATNAITVLVTRSFDSVACLRCGRCSDHCPAGLQPVRIAQAVKANDKEAMKKRGALDCIECGLCTYVCPSQLNVTENVRKAKRTLLAAKK